jgi:hypothetical protein
MDHRLFDAQGQRSLRIGDAQETRKGGNEKGGSRKGGQTPRKGGQTPIFPIFRESPWQLPGRGLKLWVLFLRNWGRACRLGKTRARSSWRTRRLGARAFFSGLRRGENSPTATRKKHTTRLRCASCVGTPYESVAVATTIKVDSGLPARSTARESMKRLGGARRAAR